MSFTNFCSNIQNFFSKQDSNFSLLNDEEITRLSEYEEGKYLYYSSEDKEKLFKPMIFPFEKSCIRKTSINKPVISYGLSSYGYDIRLSEKSFYIFEHVPGEIVDPKNFNKDFLKKQEPYCDNLRTTSYFIIPANSYALCVSHERFIMPPDVMGVCFGKSTYARIGLIVNVTPLEPSWGLNYIPEPANEFSVKGSNLTIEIANTSSSDVKVYANEGIAQLVFFRGKPANVTYADRKGKYMEQKEEVVFAKV